MLELSQTADRPAVRWRFDAATIVPLVLAAMYLAVEIYFFSIHEPWNDEAQAWLRAKELIWPDQYLVIPGEGHPPGWYWLLRTLSYVLSFDQARLLMLGITALNAWLQARLYGERPILLLMLFCSLPLLHTWGFHLRPYPLILTCVAGALLADRHGRPALATWILALSCGLSFLSGWLFAFWLVVQLQRRTPIRQLIGPALIAALFAISAMLSSTGNVDMGKHRDAFLGGFFDVLAIGFALPETPSIVIAIVAATLLGIGLRKTPLILATVLALWVMLGLFGVLLYGLREWHAAFALMFVLMAFDVTKARVWPLLLLLLAQDYWGAVKSAMEVRWPSAADGPGYEAIVNDAGDRLDTTHNLVSWPDHVLTPTAARYGFRFVSGNNGDVVAAIDLRSRKHIDMSHKVLVDGPSPYWLVCIDCENPLGLIQSSGRKVTELMPPTEAQAGTAGAYRID